MGDGDRCIWCLKPARDKDVEHIFPDAFGCPPHLTLPGTTVCRACNNGLAHLDQVVADDFDFLAVMNGIRRKGGRRAELMSRGNVYAASTADGPNIFFNLESVAHTAPTGQRVGPFQGRERDIRPQITRLADGRAEVAFEVPFGQHKKFARGLYKIALNSIAFLLGADRARDHRYDWIRTYVKSGGARRHILLKSAADASFLLASYPPWTGENGEEAMPIRIGAAEFLLDLSLNESQLPMLLEKAAEIMGDGNFSVLPAWDGRRA
jgi:hypothetical protein